MALVAGAVVCAAVAALVPVRDVVEYDDFRVLTGGGVSVAVGDTQVFVEAPPGWVITGWGTNDDGSGSVMFGRADVTEGSVRLVIAADGSGQWFGDPDDVRELQIGVRIMPQGRGPQPPPSIAPVPLP